MAKCKYCGYELPKGETKCPKCRAENKPEKKEVKEK